MSAVNSRRLLLGRSNPGSRRGLRYITDLAVNKYLVNAAASGSTYNFRTLDELPFLLEKLIIYALLHDQHLYYCVFLMTTLAGTLGGSLANTQCNLQESYGFLCPGAGWSLWKTEPEMPPWVAPMCMYEREFPILNFACFPPLYLRPFRLPETARNWMVFGGIWG